MYKKLLLRSLGVVCLLLGLIVAGKASAVVSDDGLAAYYPFNGNAADESGNGHDGAVYGAELAPDRFGNPDSTYHFDGQDYIQVNMSTEVFYGDFTVSVWVNFDHFNNDYPCILIGNNQDITLHGMGPIFDIDKIGNIVFYQMDDTTYDSIGLFDSLYKLNIGEWYLISIVKSDLNFSMYINDILRNQTTADHELSMSDSYLTIGSRRDYNGGIPWKGYENSTLNGYIDDIRIYDRALSANEIKQLYGVPFCGDGVKNGDEACDYEDASGEGVPEHYTCGQTCDLVYVPYCGDGIKDENEQCDDNNNENNDGCDANCQSEFIIEDAPFAKLIQDTINLHASGEIAKDSIKKEFLAKFTHLEKKYEQAEAGGQCLRDKIIAAYIRLSLKHVQDKINMYVKRVWITPDAAELLNGDIEDILSFIKEEYQDQPCAKRWRYCNNKSKPEDCRK